MCVQINFFSESIKRFDLAEWKIKSFVPFFTLYFVYTRERRKEWELIQEDVPFLSLFLPLYATPPSPSSVNCRNVITNGGKFS